MVMLGAPAATRPTYGQWAMRARFSGCIAESVQLLRLAANALLPALLVLPVLGCPLVTRPPTPPSVSPQAITLYDFADAHLYAFDRATGRTLAAHFSEESPVVIGGSVITADGEAVRASDLVSRRSLWSLKTAGEPKILACEQAVLVTDELGMSIVEVSSGRVRARTQIDLTEASCAHGLILHTEPWSRFIGERNEDLVALDAMTARRLWRHRTTGLREVRLTLAFGQTLLTNAGALERRDQLEALDPRRGNLLWKRPALADMTVAAPTVAVGEDSAALVALGTDGVKLWQREGRLVAASERRVFMYGPSALERHAVVFARSTAKL
jgi:outer membrane protein assembly factor BamB